MKLRELLERATEIKRVGRAIDFGSNPDTRYTVIFADEDDAIRIEALHTCFPELEKVVEAAKILCDVPSGNESARRLKGELRAALAALRGKEERL